MGTSIINIRYIVFLSSSAPAPPVLPNVPRNPIDFTFFPHMFKALRFNAWNDNKAISIKVCFEFCNYLLQVKVLEMYC